MKRLSMRKIREALRLSFEGLSTREMALSLAIGRTTLREYLGRARDAGLSWPLPDALSDADLEHVLFPRRSADSSQPIPQPDWTYVHAELRRKGVTLSLLWQEYREVHTDGYGYSRYCELYTRWEGKLSPVIPTVIDQNPCAHLRMPRDMIFHGWSMRLFQAWQHSATMSS